MGTAELHYLLGKYCAEWERKAGLRDVSVLAAAYRAGVPCYTSSPGDSTIGMNVAGVELRGNKLRLNPSIDVNETTAFVLAAKRSGGKSGVVLWGGGSPKNFMLQTEPQIQEVLRIKEYGQDYFLQVTDARPDTGGLSGATPSEAVSWGKVDPDRLPDAVVCYTDTTIAMPLFTHYALATHKPRKLRRLYDQRGKMMEALTKEYFKHNAVTMVDGSAPVV
jgi:deoxyhypusine synthase